MASIGERVKIIRQNAGLSMEKFGERVGIKKSSLSTIESGKSNPSDRTLKLICNEFRVNWLWLTEGRGDVYSTAAESLLDLLVEEYQLDDLDRRIMAMYLKLPDEARAGIRAFVQGMIDDSKKKEGED